MFKPICHLFHHLWGNLVSYIDKAPITAEEKNRLQQYTVFISLGIPTMVVYGLFHLNNHHYLLSGAIFASCAGLCAGWYLLRQLKNGRVVYRFNAFLFGFLVVVMVIIGGEGGSKILWMYTFPLVVFFLLGKTEGLIWALGLGGLAMISLWLPLPYVARYPYPPAFISRFLITYTIVTVITYWFEYFRDRYRQRMEAEQEELNREKARLKREIERRVDAEKHTHELNRKLQTVINAIPDVVYFKDKDGRLVLVNKAFKSLSGRRSEDIVGKTDAEIFPSQQTQFFMPNDAEVLLQGRQLRQEEQRLTAKGQTAIFDTIKLPLFGVDGEVIGILGVSRDITDIRNAEQALRVNQQRFREILKHSRDILYRRDLKTGQYDYISSTFSTLLSYSGEEIDDMAYYGVENMIHPADRDQHRIFIERLLAAKPGAAVDDTIEYRMIDKNGAPHWFSDRLAVVPDAYGKPAFILGSNREITAQREAEQAVRHAHSRLLTILDSIDAHVYVADLDCYDILFMNRKMKKAFGNDVQGKKCWEVFRGGDDPCPDCSNAKLLDESGLPSGVFEWEGQNPLTRRWYMNYDRAIKWIDDRWVRLEIAVDITRIKMLEKEQRDSEATVRRAQKLEAIGTLAAGIAHDFNNLLSVILGGVSLVDFELGADHESRVTLKQIEEASIKAKDLANQLITFSKGGLPVKVPGTIGRLVFLSVQSAVGDADIRCQFKLDPDLWPVAFDENQIERAMTHIVRNAIDAMPEGGTIVVEGSNQTLGPDGAKAGLMLPEGRYVKLSVHDEGDGIPDTYLSQIFDPYFSSKGKGTDKGTGLGLAITHSIVTNHGGDIQVVPKNSSGGVTFTIYLPACQNTVEVQVNPTENEITNNPPQNPIILLMDDEGLVRRLAKQMLERKGYQAVMARNGDEAIDMFTQALNSDTPFAGVILDLNVKGGLGGLDTLKALRTIDPHLCAFATSGNPYDPVMTQCQKYGFTGVIPKPFTLQWIDKMIAAIPHP